MRLLVRAKHRHYDEGHGVFSIPFAILMGNEANFSIRAACIWEADNC